MYLPSVLLLVHISDERFEMSRERAVKLNAIWIFISGSIFHIVCALIRMDQ